MDPEWGGVGEGQLLGGSLHIPPYLMPHRADELAGERKR